MYPVEGVGHDTLGATEFLLQERVATDKAFGIGIARLLEILPCLLGDTVDRLGDRQPAPTVGGCNHHSGAGIRRESVIDSH